MKSVFFLFVCFLLIGAVSQAQVGISSGSSAPHTSAGLDVNFTDKGLLPPRMTMAQRNAIVSPAAGLMVFCTDCGVSNPGRMCIYLNGVWHLLTISCKEPVVVPVAGTHTATDISINWTWSPVPNVTGYKWGATNDFATATDLGNTLSNLETGLSPVSAYTRYVWGYNDCGATAPVILNKSTITWTCGISSVPINHSIANGVAPENKSVSYGTVVNIPGEFSKCWITRNLGATAYPVSIGTPGSDSTSGWYWKFNRKQGYRNFFGVITPSWTMTNISENSEWILANDPCNLELGNVWRIPTYSEWYNVDDAGSWENLQGGWSSGLHLVGRGATVSEGYWPMEFGETGYFWSSNQATAENGSCLNISYSSSNMSSMTKINGASLRCLRRWLPEVTTSPAVSITETTASSGGNATDDGGYSITERGVCWSTAPGPTTALTTKTINGSGTGPFTSSLTGLVQDRTYYLRAYATSIKGTVYGNEVSFLTQPVTCGVTSLTINHQPAGGVAPVVKTVTYGTVKNISGELTKCWITKNLGASRQAIAVTDSADAAAGWYWQFNRKQGYRHDSVSLIPSWTITGINENSDWQSITDPCSLELGPRWRIPTNSEWINVDNAGGWTNWLGPWNSGLKLHAAGYLENGSGGLGERGVHGYNWSSKQNNAAEGWLFGFNTGFSDYMSHQKANGYPLRCLRDLLPVVTTTPVSAVMETTAASGGNVTDEGGYAVITRGLCWSTSTGPTTALATKTINGTGPGLFTNTLTGLVPNTRYYVRSYAANSQGTAYGNEVIFKTLGPCNFGTPEIVVNHVTSDGISPVNKTVTYGTMGNFPFDTTKCWITRNLGASQQATSVYDDTESSAGWYWQFNRKQGYKQDGTSVTPAWTITTIEEYSNWLSANDPCTIKLGNTWRIPTISEWTNVITTGYVGWDVSWVSGLKIHGAGTCEGSFLDQRGSLGSYWTSMETDPLSGRALLFTYTSTYMSAYYKTEGLPLRCLRGWALDVTTTQVTSVTQSTALSGGTIGNDGGYPITVRGVCWSTTTGPTTALSTKTIDGTGTGVYSSNITGLNPNTVYYVRAYATSSNGTVYGNEQSFTTLAACGTYSLTINHVAGGGVAPVTKTVTYGTVTNVPGETSKCWITRNLGASQQATAVDDNTEASAGWYWQFNRKQGYMHDGTTRTPNTAWNGAITEASDWIMANDPCALELGSTWRLPTSTEWNNVDASEGWNNNTGPWNSALKIHGAGYLMFSNGTLTARGANGDYWSSAQNTTAEAWDLTSLAGSCGVLSHSKAYGFSVRCISNYTIP